MQLQQISMISRFTDLKTESDVKYHNKAFQQVGLNIIATSKHKPNNITFYKQDIPTGGPQTFTLR